MNQTGKTNTISPIAANPGNDFNKKSYPTEMKKTHTNKTLSKKLKAVTKSVHSASGIK